MHQGLVTAKPYFLDAVLISDKSCIDYFEGPYLEGEEGMLITGSSLGRTYTIQALINTESFCFIAHRSHLLP